MGPDADDWKNTFSEIPKLTSLTIQELQKIFELHWPKLKLGKESMKNFWVEVSKVSKKLVSPQILRKKYNEAIWVDKKSLELIIKLKKNHKIIMLANDSDDNYFGKINILKLNKIFDKFYCSSQTGFSKPHVKTFKYVLNDLMIRPEEMIFIDNQKNNTTISKSLGINTIHYKNLKKLKIDFLQFL